MLRRPTPDALRLSLLYAALFSVVGVQMPFWPVWLEAQGMKAVQIGILLGAIYWAKVVTNPLIAQFVDRTGRRRQALLILAACALAMFCLYTVATGFWALLALGILSGSLIAGLMPLTETVTMTLTQRGVLDYGRVRLWGSLTFIAAAGVTGLVVEDLGPPVILWLVLGGAAATAVAVWPVPDPAPARRGGPPLPLVALFRDRRYRLFLLTASLTQASHCIYYGFATLHWRAQGVSDGLIGGLWAIGVLAEVVLFVFSGAVVRRLGAERLLFIGALGGILRWTVLATTMSPWLLVPAQTLHAATFGATHLGAMHLIAGSVDSRLSARAQALYSSVAMGLVPGLALLGAGPLYAAFGGQAFLAAALIAAAAGLAGHRLLRQGRSGA
jgi:PPP family 3-phenylpropionic acid transporter